MPYRGLINQFFITSLFLYGLIYAVIGLKCRALLWMGLGAGIFILAGLSNKDNGSLLVFFIGYFGRSLPSILGLHPCP